MADNDLQAVWRRAVNGDEQAENDIFRYLSERFSVIAGLSMCKQDANDVAHEACLAILKGYKNLGSPFEYNAWAQKVLRSKIADYFAEKAKRRETFRSSDCRQEETISAGDEIDFETLETLRRCLKKLARAYPRYAEVIHLKHLGYYTDEICAKMNLSPTNLYVLVNRARKVLRDCMFSEESK